MSIYDVFILLGGVGLFLYGMTIMSSGLKNACGDNLKVILGKATTNKVTSILAGIAVTIFVQSSSATDVMVIGFVTSGLMTLAQAIGVIMGANIGTTVTAQITAFNIGAYAPMILFIGAVMNLFLKKRTLKEVGSDGLCAAGYHFRNSGDLHRRDRLLRSSQEPFPLLRPSCRFQRADHSFRSLLRLPYPRRHSLFHADRRGRRSDLLHVIGTDPSERAAAFPGQTLHTAGIMETSPIKY